MRKDELVTQPATLQDIAKACNVSVSTVSRVLSGSGKFKPATSKKIMQAVRELNYSPNAMARGMVTKGGIKLIGFFIPNILNPFFAELVDALERNLSVHGYMLTLCLFDDDPVKLSRFLKVLTEIRAAGAIVGSCREDLCQQDFAAAKNYMSIVSIQGDVDGVDRVDVTDEEGTYEIVNYLIEKGHRNIGFLGYRYDISILRNRLNGYRHALTDHGIPVREEYIGCGSHSAESGYEMTCRMLELPQRPTAIHCFNEFMARAAFDAIRDHQLRIPEDISITGFDNISIACTLQPRLTTIAEPIDTMAQIAVTMLMNRIAGTAGPDAQHVYVRHKLIERDSVAAIQKDLTP